MILYLMMVGRGREWASFKTIFAISGVCTEIKGLKGFIKQTISQLRAE
jgi:hypothetical protein